MLFFILSMQSRPAHVVPVSTNEFERIESARRRVRHQKIRTKKKSRKRHAGSSSGGGGGGSASGSGSYIGDLGISTRIRVAYHMLKLRLTRKDGSMRSGQTYVDDSDDEVDC